MVDLSGHPVRGPPCNNREHTRQFPFYGLSSCLCILHLLNHILFSFPPIGKGKDHLASNHKLSNLIMQLKLVILSANAIAVCERDGLAALTNRAVPVCCRILGGGGECLLR